MFTTIIVFLNSPILRVEECVDDAKPVRRGFLRKGGGRHDPEDSEVTAMIMVVWCDGLIILVAMNIQRHC